MPTFEYTAIDQAGRTKTGRLSSLDETSARRIVEKRGLVLTALNTGAAATRAPQKPTGRKLSPKALTLISRQLATLITVAPVEEALRTLAAQSENRRIRTVLTNLHDGVIEGQRLSDAMGRSGAFPETYAAMIAAGESSSSLPQVLERLADLLEKQQDIRAKITSALVYPIILAIVATIVIAALMTVVVPKVVDQFNTSGQTLPALTQAIIAISAFLQSYGSILLAGIAAIIASFVFGMRVPAFKLAVDKFVLSLPVIGRLTRDVEAASFARTLSTMLAAGLPALEALKLATRTARNAVFANAMREMAINVSEGAALSTAMKRANAFPPLLIYLTQNGETGGKLDQMLDRAADYLEREFRTATTIALSLLEPAIIVIMGAIVCLVILSILLPILQINRMAY